ncbi:MAG TPA: hypothetical protein VLF19_12975 [Methylomirabilota bacterium]|nr:hypothetical protein [Methylomirabilota bacterium]
MKPAPAAILDDEARLLALARELTALARGRPPAEALDEALARLPEVERAARHDASHALALGWAREQARLALADVLERAAKAGAARADVAAGTLAWLVLAAAEAVAREPADAAPDRLHALADFVRPPVERESRGFGARPPAPR